MCLDYKDLEITLKNDNAIMMGRGFGEGKNRMEDAIANVLQSPLLHNNNLFGAEKILFNIYSSNKTPLIVEEMEGIANLIKRFSPKTEVVWGTATEGKLGGKVKMTLLATGFEKSNVFFEIFRLWIKLIMTTGKIRLFR